MVDSEKFVKVWQERQNKKGNKQSLASLAGKQEATPHRPYFLPNLTASRRKGGYAGRASDQVTPLNSFQHLTGQAPLERLHPLTGQGYEEIKPEEILKERKHLKTQRRARKVLKHSGTFIFIVSLTATIIILLPFLGVGRNKPTATHEKPLPTVKVESEDIEAKVIKEATALGLDAKFSLYVPKINAKSAVIDNVDLGKEKEYLDALKKGVAHGKGTHFPGQGGNIFLFSHSVSAPEYIKTYNAVFYDLKDLTEGDEIIIYFSGAKYVYKVSQKVITAPRDVSFLTKDYGGETLILQTCDPPGTTLRRLLVIAKPSL
jgi:LPXTG-site transpeptidase (sortase) family protein